ncbi:MAG: carbonic anhydrase [Lachnospiraceae bacterium]|nr:carbonic anhydrase [Lachnospiraceae bacterium]
MVQYEYSAQYAKEKLVEGNKAYVASRKACCEASTETLLRLVKEGQRPYAIIVACSDSRVIPEVIFQAGLGDLFVIRVAGNVMESHQLGSIEYAAEHLGTGLIVVLGHDHCGAVDAALNHQPEGYIKYITDEIVKAIGDEKDEVKACCLNVKHSCEIIEHSLQIQKDEKEYGLQVLGAIYHLEDGTVEFL